MQARFSKENVTARLEAICAIASRKLLSGMDDEMCRYLIAGRRDAARSVFAEIEKCKGFSKSKFRQIVRTLAIEAEGSYRFDPGDGFHQVQDRDHTEKRAYAQYKALRDFLSPDFLLEDN